MQLPKDEFNDIIDSTLGRQVKKLDHDEQREEIAAITAELIAEQGIEKLTLQLVADTMNCTKGKLFHYYANKDDLVYDTFQRADKRMEARIMNVIKDVSKDDWIDKLVIDALPLTQQSDIEWKVRQNYWQYTLQNPDKCTEQVHAMRERVEMVKTVVHSLLDRGYIRDDMGIDNIIYMTYDAVFGLAINLLFFPLGEERLKRATPLKAFLHSLSS